MAQHINLTIHFDASSVDAAVRQLTAVFRRAYWRAYYAGGWRDPMPQLTTGCRCREAAGWYPGRPDAPDCPVHRPHRCNIHLLGRSWRSEGCGWRCPRCGTEWTLSIVHKLYEQHRTPYGVHPRAECGPAFCDLLPPRPVMEWVRDEVI
ncbi:hypothetical protein [Kribbella catacumbae]|uniref:hypothetical protein n=1 Tax=Kribbella catacumbae TaxID=460086 RepID=UPI00038036AD|nr:hypothetical protein [Kribbella catacumbae]